MKIKIIAVPPGFAPEEIRQAWVGVEIPLVTEEELSVDPPVATFGTAENAGGYMVTFGDAISALREARKEPAAVFWEDMSLGIYLEFNKNVCQLVE